MGTATYRWFPREFAPLNILVVFLLIITSIHHFIHLVDAVRSSSKFDAMLHSFVHDGIIPRQTMVIVIARPGFDDLTEHTENKSNISYSRVRLEQIVFLQNIERADDGTT